MILYLMEKKLEEGQYEFIMRKCKNMSWLKFLKLILNLW